jgi:hypothetical protein
LWVVGKPLVTDPIPALQVIGVPFSLFSLLGTRLLELLIGFHVLFSWKVAVVVEA